MNASFYEKLCSHAGVALIAADADLTLRVWNQAATRLLGLEAGDMIGQPIVDAFPSSAIESNDSVFEHVLKLGEVKEFEICHTDANDNPLHLAVTISPILDERGPIIGVSACFRDITRRVSLEHTVARNQKMAALGALSGGVAHHFNNLLGGVVTAVDFARSSGDSRSARRALDVTAEAVAQLTRLIEHLLAFAEGDRRETDMADLTETVLRFVDRIEERLRVAEVRLALTLRPVPVVEVPAIRLLTVLENLLDNALDAMPAGGEVEIRLERRGNQIVLRMADSGVGVERDHIDHIFEPFFSTKTAQSDGSGSHVGLGLAAAHGIVRELGGEIEVASEPGRGSSFDIILPVP
jgi:PAS domain S-box-containing protein